MAKSPFQPVLFHPFRAMLTRAAAAGHRIEPVDKEKWSAHMREHKIPIAGLMVYGQALSETIKPVIVRGEGPEDGLYFYSDDDEVAARFVAPDAGASGAATPSAPEAPPASAPAPPAAEPTPPAA